MFFQGRLTLMYDANVLEGPSRWGDWVILSPILGGLVVVWLVRNFAPEAKGHGVPEVMDAIFYKQGNIRWPGRPDQVAGLGFVDRLRRGGRPRGSDHPDRRGARLLLVQLLGLSTRQKITLLSAGAGAGIAATFNTPIGGVLFALEILLPEVSNRTFLPVVIATGAATLLGRILIGPNPAFIVPEIQFPSAGSFGVEEALACVLLGALCGLAAYAFIRVLVFMEDGFPEDLPRSPYVQNVIGMGLVGLTMVILMNLFGHPYIDGVGYGVIQSILDKNMTRGLAHAPAVRR